MSVPTKPYNSWRLKTSAGLSPLFADATRFGGVTLDIASDTVSGAELGAAFSEAAGRPISCARFSDDVLPAYPFRAKLTELVDGGPLAGKANLKALREIEPNLQTFRTWLATTGRAPFGRALGTAGDWGWALSASLRRNDFPTHGHNNILFRKSH